MSCALALGACKDADERAHEARTGAGSESAELRLSSDAARGLATTPAEATQARRVLAVPGRVLDGAALVELASALARAELAAGSAARDLERTRRLAQDDANASQRELEAAQLAEADARGALAAARARAAASFGTADPARVAPLASAIARGALALGRIELPPGAPLPDAHAVLRVSTPTLAGPAPRARLVGPAGALDSSLQGAAVLVAVDPAPPAGATLEAEIETGAPESGVWLPESAVIWSDGSACAFVASAATRFVRRPLGDLRPLRGGYFVASGVAPGERVVTRGAQQLLSAQLTTRAPDED
jgi:hypothetical protein